MHISGSADIGRNTFSHGRVIINAQHSDCGWLNCHLGLFLSFSCLE
ncbi:hypothetical protein GRAN_1419 [Granulicella sibirica]|uniref:Uncharacterized protein n=1 Tax=Granulicella sibirica TaxID=2479048 RepID=A0A4Q0T7W5_9BACT|nr:hypothetical protein GRAN_1419 [Granulicella sibirica]